MKTCTKCNLSYDDDKKFCKKCGGSLISENLIDPKNAAKKSVFEDRLKADPLNLEILNEYAQFLYAQSLFKETITVSFKILAIKEKDDLANNLLFQSYLKLQLFKEALETGNQILSEKPKDISLLEELAKIEEKLGHSDRSSTYYDIILGIQPENTAVLYKKAMILLEANQVNSSIEVFTKIHKLGQNDRITTIYAGINKVLNEEYNDAINILKPVLSEKELNCYNLDNIRGILYMSYSLCQVKADINEITNWLQKIDPKAIVDNDYTIDDDIFAKSILYIATYKIENNITTTNAPIIFENLEETYLNHFKFKDNSIATISKVWYHFGLKQFELKFFKAALRSFQKAIELLPGENIYQEKLNDTQKLVDADNKKKKKKTNITVASIAVVIIIIVALIVVNISLKESRLFESAKKEASVSACQAYLKAYPQGKYVLEVTALQEEPIWKNIKYSNTYDGYTSYLSSYPNGKYVNEAKQLREKCINVIFNDDFNDNTINSDLWIVQGIHVREENGEMKMEQNVTDQPTGLTSKEIPFDASRPVQITRKVLVHYASEYYYGGMSVTINDSQTIAFSYLHSAYNDNAYTSMKDGIFVHSGDRSFDELRIANNIFDRWFTETILYNPQNGMVSYLIDQHFFGEFQSNTKLRDKNSLKLAFSPFGWWTGHYHYMDDLKIIN